MIMLFVVACLVDAPRDCRTVYYPETFRTTRECAAMLRSSMLMFPTMFPWLRIERIECEKDEVSL